tara:strand:- start:155815 stop:156960 length:1146 start_codon:yes stop_codon:yes gene_type:complete
MDVLESSSQPGPTPVMNFAADFTAIDFETASRRSDSACQLGAVKVRGGKIVDSAMWLIRPEPLYFSPMNIRIHGIRPEQVRDEPTFGDLWDEVQQRFGDDCLVAHNASFDMGVLLACLRKSRRPIPDLHYTCTRAIARRTWPQRRRYGLKPLSEWLGTEFRHHDALEDSVACAKILIAAGIAREAASLPDLESRLRLTRGRAGDWGMKGPMKPSGRSAGHSAGRNSSRSGSRSHSAATRSSTAISDSQFGAFGRDGVFGRESVGAAAEQKSGYEISPAEPKVDIQRLLIRADFIQPLAGQHVVFSGRMQQLSRDDALQLASRLGGQCDDAVTGQTNMLVIGAEDAGGDPHQQTAETLRASGQSIRILSEDEFLSLVIAPAP